MAFPASQQTLEDALSSIRHAALKLKSTDYTNLQLFITRTIAQWDEAAVVPGLVQYAKDQYDDQTIDLVVEYQAMKASAGASGFRTEADALLATIG